MEKDVKSTENLAQRYAVRQQLWETNGRLTALLEAYGDKLGAQNGWALDGLEAVRFHLMQKFRWLPADVLAMSPEHLRFALHDELERWQAPTGIIRDLRG